MGVVEPPACSDCAAGTAGRPSRKVRKGRRLSGGLNAGQEIRFMDTNSIGKDIVHSAIIVHSALGPGLLESAYQKCLAYELQKLGH